MFGRAKSIVVFFASTLWCSSAQAQTVGTCEHGIATRDVDIGNVRAAMYTNGNLFWQRAQAGYEIPKGSNIHSLFAHTLLIGGLVNNEIRVSGSLFGNYKFWPGPLGDDGSPPDDCGKFDRIWKINRTDIRAFEDSGVPAIDLLEWPSGLGAPTLSPTNPDLSATDSDGVDNDSDGVVDELGEMRSITEEILALPLAERTDRVIDLAAGERPDLLGDQMLWWIMNDAGNERLFADGYTTESVPPIGLEIHQSAFAFAAGGDLPNTTFYRYRIFYKGLYPFEQAYIGNFVDPDLGASSDDYIGSDTTLGLGIVYNADNNDDVRFAASGDVYGTAPPALGYDFLIGPVVASEADTARTLLRRLPELRNLHMTSFMYYNGGGAGLPYTDPRLPAEFYTYLRGVWKDGSPVKASGDGYNTTETKTTTFMYPGDAASGAFWSEFDADGRGTPNTPADRRFIVASGPFEMQPGSEQDILIGVVWARGVTNLDSYLKMKLVDRKIQRFVDSGFPQSNPPDPPIVAASEFDGTVVLTWSNPDSSNNVLDSYREFAPLGDLENPYYEFEGYEVWEFDRSNDEWPECVKDERCRLLKVFDVANGATEIVGDDDGDKFLNRYAFGTDSGLRHSIELSGLTNYATHHYGVRSYAYNADANPLVLFSRFSRVAATPSRRSDNLSAAAVNATKADSTWDLVATIDGIGDGLVAVEIVDPTAIRGCEYRVVFYAASNTTTSTTESRATSSVGVAPVVVSSESEALVDAAPRLRSNRPAAGTATLQKSSMRNVNSSPSTYDIFCGDEKRFDGSGVIGGAPFVERALLIDGLEFTVLDPVSTIRSITVVANAAGVLPSPEIGTYAVDDHGEPNGFPKFGGQTRPTRGIQQANTNAVWGLAHGGGADGTYDTFRQRVLRNDNVDRISAYDYEMRFTSAGGMATRAFDDGADINVPFEIWRTGVATPDEPSDDVRLIPFICEEACRAGLVANQFDIGMDHFISGDDDDPYTDWVYWYLPEDVSPGQAGYDRWFSLTDDDAGELFGRTVLVQLDGGSSPPYNPPLPEEGTIFRITTTKPFVAGDVATFSTVGLEPSQPSQSERVARLEEIGIVPNPYRGASQYESSTVRDEVRFTNLPDEATIRVFALNGRLVRTIYKNVAGQAWLSWDVRSDAGRPLASGVYLVHVEVPGVGTQVIKFGYVGKRWGD